MVKNNHVGIYIYIYMLKLLLCKYCFRATVLDQGIMTRLCLDAGGKE